MSEKKALKAKEIYAYLEGMVAPEYCPELIEHWQWVKRRSLIYKLTFELSPDVADLIFAAIYYFRTYQSTEIVLEYFKPLVIEGQESFEGFVGRYKLDNDFMIEICEYEELKNYGCLYFSCTTSDVAENIKSIFALCPVTNLNLVNVGG